MARPKARVTLARACINASRRNRVAGVPNCCLNRRAKAQRLMKPMRWAMVPIGGVAAQHTAVHVGRAAQALSDLIASPDLRMRMGAAGRERVRTAFDWPVVAGQYNDLLDELAEIRGSTEGWPGGADHDPVRADPFEAFAGFATQGLGPETALSLAPGVDGADLQRSAGLTLDSFAASWRATPEEAARLLDLIGSRQAQTLAALLDRFPPPRRPHIELTVAWMAKMGMLDWL